MARVSGRARAARLAALEAARDRQAPRVTMPDMVIEIDLAPISSEESYLLTEAEWLALSRGEQDALVAQVQLGIAWGEELNAIHGLPGQPHA